MSDSESDFHNNLALFHDVATKADGLYSCCLGTKLETAAHLYHMAPRNPLLSLELEATDTRTSSPSTDEPEKRRRTWTRYLPLCFTVFLILSPHPSLLFFLVDYHIRTRHEPLVFVTHLVITYALTFLVFSSLIVCVARDPGPVTSNGGPDGSDYNEEVGLTEALVVPEDDPSSRRWCRKCWIIKPERTHHCSYCGCCVLKMDHHCPWIGSKCVGHRTYPAFLHFLCSVTLLAAYIAVISICALCYAFNNPLAVNEVTPLHELFLACTGVVFSLVVGSFLCYHLYLVSTNQTTLENISPFILLRHLPPLPGNQSGLHLSNPPLEAELNYTQRRLVKRAHGYIRRYDIGWRKNWAQVFGWNREYGWLYRMWCGGSSQGDGRSFPRNSRADEMLTRLAMEIVNVDKDN